MTVAEFSAAARSVGEYLAARGVTPGDRVAVMAGNSLAHLAVVYGTWFAGGVEVAVNAELRGPMLRHVLEDSRPGILIADSRLCPLVADLGLGIDIVPIDDVPTTGAKPGAEITSLPGSGDLASLLYTSGTTGPSKGVMLPHGYYSYHASVLGEILNLEAADIGYFCLPFFHVDSHIAMPAHLQFGSILAFAPRFSVRSFWADVARFQATWFGAVGSMLSALAAAGDPPDGATDRVRLILAAPVPPEAYGFFTDRLGIPVLQMYGQTEANGPIYSTVDRNRRGAMGLAHPNFDVRIIDASGGDVVAPRTVGELLIAPRFDQMIAEGYWCQPETTRKSFVDGWFHTGDLVSQDADGYFWYAGRNTDSLRRRGENVSAHELESVVRSAPGVRDCAAVGVRDPLGGEDEIKVFVVADGSFDAARFRSYCGDALPRFAMPRYVQLVAEEALRRGPGTGAVQKHLLDTTVGEGVIDLSPR